ncbi:MAG: hypothetical protein H0T89_27590 [Deltaproteobacteria bacterium]|nr:hypothetical protein [Deltaproteobacteria bacterium]
MIDNELHVSDLRWDRLLAGELAGDAKAAVLAHADTCVACGSRLALLTRESEAFAMRPGLAPARSRRWWWAVAPALLAAAAVVVLVVPRGPKDEAGERAKGTGPSLIVMAGPAERLALVASGDRVHFGDSVQAGYTATRDGFGAVLGRDGSGRAMAHVPSRGDVMVALPAGTSRSFPESTVLDATPGAEQLVVLWCEAAHPLHPLLAALAANRPITPPAGCTAHHVNLVKQATPR